MLTLRRTHSRPAFEPVGEPTPLCEVTLSHKDGVLVLSVRGCLVASSMPALSAQIDQLQCSPCEQTEIDIRAVEVIDHVGLNALAGLAHYISARGGRLVIGCCPGAIRGWLISTGLGRHLDDTDEPGASDQLLSAAGGA